MAGTAATPQPPSPPNGLVLAKARGWLGLVEPVLQRATPITLLVTFLLGGLLVYGQHHELVRRAANTEKLVYQVFADKDKQIAWLLERVPCARPDGAR